MLRRSEHTPSLSCAHCALSLTQLAKAAAMLGGASRPLFILGSQSVLMGPSRAEELASALTKLGAPCFLVGPDFQNFEHAVLCGCVESRYRPVQCRSQGGMARGLLGRNGPNHVRQNVSSCVLRFLACPLALPCVLYGAAGSASWVCSCWCTGQHLSTTSPYKH